MARSVLRSYVVRQAGGVARMAGSISANQRLLPDFLIVGTQRGGTTSMFKALLQHPSFIPPRLRKGVHYFDVAYDRGPRWYRGHFARTAQAEEQSQRIGAPVITGEASPYYMFHPTAAERIAADLPNAKLVVLLRDPVERAYSGHAHEFARGFETETFERALELEPERLAGEADRMRADPSYHSHAMQHLAHLSRGEYIDQLEHLEKVFGRDRLLVLDSQDYFVTPGPVFAEMCAFLGIPDAAVEHDQHNARPRKTMDPELEQLMRGHFEPFDTRLAAWWGQTPSWRR